MAAARGTHEGSGEADEGFDFDREMDQLAKQDWRDGEAQRLLLAKAVDECM
jgi:hypothetical protein